MINNFDYDIAIIGGGVAGISDALEANKLGFKTLLIEKDSLGGIAFNAGDIIFSHLFKWFNKNRNIKNNKKASLNAYLANKEAYYKDEYIKNINNSKHINLLTGEAIIVNNNKIKS